MKKTTTPTHRFLKTRSVVHFPSGFGSAYSATKTHNNPLQPTVSQLRCLPSAELAR